MVQMFGFYFVFTLAGTAFQAVSSSIYNPVALVEYLSQSLPQVRKKLSGTGLATLLLNSTFT